MGIERKRRLHVTYEPHPVDTLLRAAAGDPSPSYADVLKARQALDAAIAAETVSPPLAASRPRRVPPFRSWWRPVSTAAVVMAILIVVVAVAGLLAPEPVTALGELATVAERRDPVVAAESQYAYSRLEQVRTEFLEGADMGLPERGVVAFQLPRQRETWRAGDGSVFERTIIGEPLFFDSETEAAFAASGLDERFQVGEVTESEYVETRSILAERLWPTDAGVLLAAMRSWVSNEGNPVSETAAVVELAGELLRETGAEPELRAAVLRALDELGLDTFASDDGRRTTVAIQYVDGEVVRLELQFDADANLVAERLIWVDDSSELGVAAGTAILQSEYSPVRTVDSIDVP